MSRSAIPTAALLEALLAAGILDQNPPHRLRCGSEEVAPAVPLLDLCSTSTSRRYASCTSAVA